MEIKSPFVNLPVCKHNCEGSDVLLIKTQILPRGADFLTKQNYLSEFITELERVRARLNLGIPEVLAALRNELLKNIEDLDIPGLEQRLTKAIESISLKIENVENNIKLNELTFNNLLNELENELRLLIEQVNKDNKFSGKADEVIYNNEAFNVSNVKQALDAIINNLSYSEPDNWNYTFYTNPNSLSYGQKRNVIWEYKVNSPNKFIEGLKINFDNKSFTTSEGYIEKEISNPTSVSLTIDTTTKDIKGNKPKIITITKTIPFNYKCFVWTSKNSNLLEIPESKQILQNEQKITCNLDLYIYCLLRNTLADSVLIKDENSNSYDSGAFELIEHNYTLPAGSFNDLSLDVEGYSLFRTTNKLNGTWNIKF